MKFNKPYDFTGTRRGNCSTRAFLGIFAYFDNATQKVKIVKDIDAESGISMIDGLKNV